ncbi:hypothetical protein MJM99_32885, partial [Salmonella enterica subsp. enterica serovar Kentucky]|nr:hypothetical protein [Salmonella enterica subsp. enterica serovar Kentucky]
SYVYLDESKEVYKRLIVSEDNKTLLGAVLVGDTSDYGNLLQLGSIPILPLMILNWLMITVFPATT